jgi:hypothetical protein
MKIIIIGGGAAGFFAAINAAEFNPRADITILERGKEVLQKVKISGGGRCNVTHACFFPRELVKNYPRGEKALLSPFMQFSAQDTLDWFAHRGVKLKTEADGRIFPVTNSSETIMDCLIGAANRLGVKILRGCRAESLEQIENQWLVKTNEKTFRADKLLVATGSATAVWDILSHLGHTVVPPVPSLFTFNIRDTRLQNLLGISIPEVEIEIVGTKLKATGPLLITHWGLSGPAVLKLSAWAARQLFDRHYRFTIRINFTSFYNYEGAESVIHTLKQESPRKLVVNTPQYNLPKRLWERLVLAAEINAEAKWADISKKQSHQLAEQLTRSPFEVTGKSTFKEEFVTAGGVKLDEVNFKTFESKRLPNLYFAGEVLDIDAVTGGFNFQAAWTGGWIAAKAMSEQQ